MLASFPVALGVFEGRFPAAPPPPAAAPPPEAPGPLGAVGAGRVGRGVVSNMNAVVTRPVHAAESPSMATSILPLRVG